MRRAVKILERITKQVIKEFWRKAASQEGDPKLPLGEMRVPPNIWFHASPYPKRHLDRFIRFSTAHGYVQQTYTHRARNIGSNMLHLCTTCMRCGLIAGRRPQWVRHTEKPSVGGHVKCRSIAIVQSTYADQHKLSACMEWNTTCTIRFQVHQLPASEVKKYARLLIRLSSLPDHVMPTNSIFCKNRQYSVTAFTQ